MLVSRHRMNCPRLAGMRSAAVHCLAGSESTLSARAGDQSRGWLFLASVGQAGRGPICGRAPRTHGTSAAGETDEGGETLARRAESIQSDQAPRLGLYRTASRLLGEGSAYVACAGRYRLLPISNRTIFERMLSLPYDYRRDSRLQE